ncbi:TolC family protein [Rhizobium sp. MHM7A]|nr:TolC family protein [Rhizobium sp. MHM7A]
MQRLVSLLCRRNLSRFYPNCPAASPTPDSGTCPNTTRPRLGKPAHQKSLDLTRTSYETGASDLLDVFSAKRSLFSAQTNAKNRVAMALDYVSLNKALGAGWDGKLEVSKPVVVDGKIEPRLANK